METRVEVCKMCSKPAKYRIPSFDGVFCSDTCARAAWTARAISAEATGAASTTAPAPEPAQEQAPEPEPEPERGRPRITVEHVDLNLVSLDVEEMGRAGWSFTHAIGNGLENDETTKQLTLAQKAALLAFVSALTVVYPCPMCRGHFTDLVARKPPRVATAEEFRTWLCEVHNEVNVRLKKPTFPCECNARHIDCEASQ